MESYFPGAARTLASPPSRVRAAQPLPAPRPLPELPHRTPAALHEVHLHFHSATAQDIAEIMRRELS
jgi:hypothetical protein